MLKSIQRLTHTIKIKEEEMKHGVDEGSDKNGLKLKLI